MDLELIRPEPEHVPELGRIFFESFQEFFDRHRAPADLPSREMAMGAMGMFIERPDFYGVAARSGGELIGSNFYSSTDAVAGVGPITVKSNVQARGVGRALMQNVVDHALANHGPQVRLVQDAINMTSLSLYSSIGFDVREPLILTELKPAPTPDESVRPVTEQDVDTCDGLCREIYKVSRKNELLVALVHGEEPGMTPYLREREGRIVGYAVPGFFGYGVAETNDDLLTILTQALRHLPPGSARWLCPARNTELYRMALRSGARALRCLNLMSIGPYEAPEGTWSPSIAY